MKNGIFILTITIATVALTGCQATKWSKDSLQNLNPVKHLSPQSKDTDAEPEFEEPVRMAVIWTDGEYKESGKPPVKGFGARIYFYRDSGEPIKADGELVVYGYDDAENHHGFSADKKFVFRRTEFQSHFSESGLGDSYSVWVPWEKVGGIRKSVSLIPIFKTASGKVLRGDQSVNMLPGKNPIDNSVTKSEVNISQTTHMYGIDDNSNVVTADYVESNGKRIQRQQPVKRARETTTIAMPTSMSQRLAAAPQQFDRRVRTPRRNRLKPVTNAIADPTDAAADSVTKEAEPKDSKPAPMLYGQSGFAK